MIVSPPVYGGYWIKYWDSGVNIIPIKLLIRQPVPKNLSEKCLKCKTRLNVGRRRRRRKKQKWIFNRLSLTYYHSTNCSQGIWHLCTLFVVSFLLSWWHLMLWKCVWNGIFHTFLADNVFVKCFQRVHIENQQKRCSATNINSHSQKNKWAHNGSA